MLLQANPYSHYMGGGVSQVGQSCGKRPQHTTNASLLHYSCDIIVGIHSTMHLVAPKIIDYMVLARYFHNSLYNMQALALRPDCGEGERYPVFPSLLFVAWS